MTDDPWPGADPPAPDEPPAPPARPPSYPPAGQHQPPGSVPPPGEQAPPEWYAPQDRQPPPQAYPPSGEQAPPGWSRPRGQQPSPQSYPPSGQQPPPGSYPQGQQAPPGSYPQGQQAPPGWYPQGQHAPPGSYPPGSYPPGQPVAPGYPPGQQVPPQPPPGPWGPSPYQQPAPQQYPWGVGWAPAPVPPRRRRHWPLVALTTLVVVGTIGAAVVVAATRTPDHPGEWDSRVAPLAEFVERERGLDFDHPVTVEFLSPEAYSEAARFDAGELTPDDRQALEDSAALYQALGLVPDDIDLIESTNAMADSGTLAFYDPVAERVTVRGTEMTTGLAVTLVHELVHVAQDQAFDLERPPPGDSAGAYEGYDALIEGDASRVEMAYLATLSSEEQAGYWEDYDAEYEASQEQLSEVPGALQAMFGAPYALGPPMVDLLVADGGNDAVDDAFASPPASSEHLFDPRSFFGDDQPVDVEPRDIPDDGDRVGKPDELGATAIFLMLAEFIDPLVALSAADGWGGDAYSVYRLEDNECVRLDIVGDSPEETAELAAALAEWELLVGHADVEEVDGKITVDRCAGEIAGGPSDAAVVGAYDALALPATRSQLMVAGAAQGQSHEEAFAAGDCFVREVPIATLLESNASGSRPPELLAALDTCGLTP